MVSSVNPYETLAKPNGWWRLLPSLLQFKRIGEISFHKWTLERPRHNFSR